MVELTPGSRVYVYCNILEQASRRSSGSGCAAFLLNSFYTNRELVGKNLTGANGKQSIDQDILNSIVGKRNTINDDGGGDDDDDDRCLNERK